MKRFYPNIEDFANDIAKVYHETLQAFYDLGARYIQLDDVYWAGLTDGTQKVRGRQRSEDEKLKARDLAYKVINKASKDCQMI